TLRRSLDEEGSRGAPTGFGENFFLLPWWSGEVLSVAFAIDGHDREGFACRSRRRSLAGSMTRTRGNPLGARDAKPGRVPRGCYFKLAAVSRLGGSTPRASRYFPEERSTGGAQFPGLAHHFLDLRDVLLLELDLLTRVFLKPDALVND